MAQDQILNTGDGGQQKPLGHIAGPDIGDVLQRSHRALDKVRVIHGANEEYFPSLTGKEVGSVRKSLRDVFNLPSDAVAYVDGKQVNDAFVLGAGQTLEFQKEAGTKG
jgi:hypothetical protein